MFSFIELTKDRNLAIHAFETLRIRALRSLIWAKLFRREMHLASFPRETHSGNRNFIGLQEIPVEKITGTLSREADFDNQFRPLKNHLRERRRCHAKTGCSAGVER